MRRSLAVIAALLLMASAAAFLSYRGAIRHGFSARAKPWAIEAFAARQLRRLAIGTEARSLVNLHEPTPGILAQARHHYVEECALCHGLDGSGETEIGEGLYPPAPDLRRPETQQLTDGELYTIIRNGIRFTGMPAWGDDDGHWKLVVFLRHLPDLTPAELEEMREAQSHHREAEPARSPGPEP